MKKLIALLLALSLVLAFVGCAKTETTPETTVAPTVPATTTAPETEPATEATEAAPVVTGMTHEEYVAAELDSEVEIVTYVQAHQSWWDNKVTVYAQSPDGAYFLYEMACSEEDAEKLVPGTKIHVTGYKSEWAGEVEVTDATFEFVDDGDSWIAPATEISGDLVTLSDPDPDEWTQALIMQLQNKYVSIHSVTVEKIAYKNDAPGDDIYVTVRCGADTYDLCVEAYLTGPETQVYQDVCNLKEGDRIYVFGFLYWYEGINMHITSVYPASEMSASDYAAIELDGEVDIVTYVQAHQSWWDGKVTVYCQSPSPEGGYFLYEMACSEEDAEKLVPGTKIHVTGYKSEWAGEVEVTDATFEFVDDGDTWISDPYYGNSALGKDSLIDYQNERFVFYDMTVESISYKNDEPGDDIYLTLGYEGSSYNFCVEAYLTGPETEVYQTVCSLKEGNTIDVECFLYWYEEMNPHIIAVTNIY